MSIKEYIEEVEKVRERAHAEILNKLGGPSLAITREQFEQNHGMLQLRVDRNIERTLEDVRDQLTPGSQLWMMRKERFFHKSYSHVALVAENGKFIHATAPDISMEVQSKAVIKEDDLDSIDAMQACFVVSPPTEDPIYLARAKECIGIRFDYDASSANCETFCQHIHGVWDKAFQSPTGGGQQAVNAFTKCSRLYKFKDKPLKEQMKKRITDASLILPDETFC